MNIENIPQGHWQNMIKLSPYKKAWMKDILTYKSYTIDENGVAYSGLNGITPKLVDQNSDEYKHIYISHHWKPSIGGISTS